MHVLQIILPSPWKFEVQKLSHSVGGQLPVMTAQLDLTYAMITTWRTKGSILYLYRGQT